MGASEQIATIIRRIHTHLFAFGFVCQVAIEQGEEALHFGIEHLQNRHIEN
jgi:hypothetical protein